MSRLDPVALKIQALIPAPVGNQTTLNWVPDIVTNTQQQIPSLKIDQDFGPNTKTNFFWTNQSTNQIANPDGLPIPLTSSRPKIVGGNQYRFNLDRTISPTMLAHLGFGFYRFHNPDSSPEGVLTYDAKGQLGLVGSATGVGFPAISGLTFNNEGGVSASGNTGFGPTTADHQTTDLASITGSWSWIRGKHSFKSGFEFKQDVYSDENLQGAEGVYAFSGAQTAPPYPRDHDCRKRNGQRFHRKRLRQLPAGRREFHDGQPAERYTAPPNYSGTVFPGHLQGHIETDCGDGSALGSCTPGT